MHRNEAGEVVHVTDKPVDVNQSVTACVDWDRRQDHMQQHTGQAQSDTIALRLPTVKCCYHCRACSQSDAAEALSCAVYMTAALHRCFAQPFLVCCVLLMLCRSSCLLL